MTACLQATKKKVGKKTRQNQAKGVYFQGAIIIIELPYVNRLIFSGILQTFSYLTHTTSIKVDILLMRKS